MLGSRSRLLTPCLHLRLEEGPDSSQPVELLRRMRTEIPYLLYTALLSRRNLPCWGAC